MNNATDITATQLSMPRMITLVGRPNVGKSAIFNRLLKERVAIVHHLPGVTRDRIIRDMSWDDERLVLCDTGGLSGLDGEIVDNVMDAGIESQVAAALEDTSVAILVVDIVAGVTPQDEEMARLLRKRGLAAVVAANKADEGMHEMAALDFERLGFPVFPVSALHGRGFADLMEKVLELLPPGSGADSEEAATPDLKVAVAGRPNAGKSSFINRLLDQPRVMVSDIPGTTRDSIDVPFTTQRGGQIRRYCLIDTAGARRDTKIDTAVERYSRYRTQDSIRRADVVILMLDAVRGVGRLDKNLASEIQEHRRGCIVVVNKWDLVQEEETFESYAELLQRELPFLGYCPVSFISAETGLNVRGTLDILDHVAEQMNRTLPTGILNRVLERAVAATPPPVRKGRFLRIFYATQVSRNPLIIRLFVNDPSRMAPSYRNYLVNQLRRAFGLEGAPVLLQLRMRTRTPRKPGAGAEPPDEIEQTASPRPAVRQLRPRRPAGRRRSSSGMRRKRK